MLPGVTCLCPTFARPPRFLHLLEESVESFRRQDYAGPAELLIMNDCPQQQLECAAHGVRIINLPERLSSLGAKYNAMVQSARADLLLPWEDDDLSLPGRISQAVERIGDAPYWNPQRSFFLEGNTLHTTHTHGVCHNASIFTRAAWQAVGGYPPTSGAQDAIMDQAMKSLGPMPPALSDDPSEWQYIYCWGRSNIHLSGHHDPVKAYAEYGRSPVQVGKFVIVPR